MVDFQCFLLGEDRVRDKITPDKISKRIVLVAEWIQVIYRIFINIYL